MIDWHVLLAPLVVLPVVLLFVFVGCKATESANPDPLFGTARQLRLNFNIQQSSPAITGIAATFKVHPSGGVEHTFPPIPSDPLDSSQNDVSGTLKMEFDNDGDPFSCTCQVDVLPAGLVPQQFASAPEATGSVTFQFHADVNNKSFSLFVQN